MSTPPSHMIGDDTTNYRVNAWIRSKNNGLFVKPRLFTPYAEEIKVSSNSSSSSSSSNRIKEEEKVVVIVLFIYFILFIFLFFYIKRVLAKGNKNILL